MKPVYKGLGAAVMRNETKRDQRGRYPSKSPGGQPKPKPLSELISYPLATQQVCRKVGATPRQLQWWDEHGLVRPRHVGHSRLWDREHVTIAFLAAELRRKGVSIQLARRVVLHVSKVIDLAKRDSRFYVVTDGRKTVTTDHEEAAFEAAMNWPGTCAVVRIEP